MFKDRISKRARWAISIVVATMAIFGTGFLTSPANALPQPSRESGADRYETSATVSASNFSPGVPVAFIATGENFPDALAGAAAAAKEGGPVLLVHQNSIPGKVADELTRLQPGRIVILGGTAAVSNGVATTLDQYTNGTVTREDGSDRYDTAAKTSHDTFASSQLVYIATGQDFPDALSAGPGVFKKGPGPVLLVMQNSIPDTVKAELQRLSAKTVVVIGGSSAVSDAVVNALDPYSTDPVTRISGADRYSTSVEVSKADFAANTGTVFLATGVNFPDALAAGPAAAKKGGPVLLVQSNCVPQGTKDELTRLNPTQIIIVGGTSAVGTGVESLTVCTTQPTFPGGGTDFGIPTTGGLPTGGTDFGIPSTGGFPTGGTSTFGFPTG
jgi:putative cell wall-binding protein